MKKKISKLFGVGLAVILLSSLFGFAVPVSAAAPLPTINAWDTFDYPVAGNTGGWFWDPDIRELGPMDKALNGDIYVYARVANEPAGSYHKILRSTNGGRSWTDSAATLRYGNIDVDPVTAGLQSPGEVVDMVCSSMYEDVLYVTDGNYVYKSSDNADTWGIVGKADLEKMIEGDCGITIDEHCITCIDVGYDAASKPYIFIGVTTTFDADGPDDLMGTTDDDAFGAPTGPADILYIDETAIGATWISLDLSCYSCGGFIPYAVGVTPDFATAPTKLMAVVSSPYTMNFDQSYAGVVTVTAGAAPAYVTYGTLPGTVAYTGGGSPDTIAAGNFETFTCDASGTGNASVCLDVTGDATVAVTTAGVTLGSTHVISSTLGVCGWGEVAELVWNCVPTNHFMINHAARIGYPDDYTDARLLFVGVASITDRDNNTGTGTTDTIDEGGDVYSVVTAPVGTSADLNVAGSLGGCIGKTVGTNICGLDVCGDTADAAVIAGAMDDTTAYTSIDGGWTWAISKKSPTGVNETWVQWVGDDCGATALAATALCDCAISITCGPDIGLYWNQASLINTCISCVLVVDHSPGYYSAGVSDTFFMLTTCDDACVRPDPQRSFSVFRYEGDPTKAGTSSPEHPWERVFSSRLYAASIDMTDDAIEFLMVSPDFQDTEALFIGNSDFEIFRSLDAGCSWFKFAYPCAPRPTASAMIAVDKETVVVGGQLAGATKVWKTTRHGTRPFSVASITGVTTGTWPRSFDFIGNNFVMGDSASQVFISSDGALKWQQVDADLEGDVAATAFNTSVIFDPGYAVSGDPGENTIYAAAGDDIYRCVIDPDLKMSLQTWATIYSCADSVFWGMAVAGDTVLYVGDRAAVGATLTLGGMVRSLNPTDPVARIAFERVNFGLVAADDLTSLQFCPTPAATCGMPLTAGVNGCPNSNVLWAVDRCATGTERVWFFEDTLARKINLASPSNGAEGLSAVIGTTSATIEWEKVCGVTCYEKEVWFYCPGCDEKTMVAGFPECFDCSTTVPCVGCSGDTCCQVVSGLSPGVTYYWRVRVGGVPGECDGCPMLSKWSDTYTFTTGLLTPVRCSPICGAEDVIITPAFTWSEVSGASGYEIEVATNEDFDPIVASGTPTINAWDCPELEYGTSYYWRVRAIKDGVVGSWTYCKFSTEEAPPEAPPQVWVCPQCGLTFSSEAALQAHIDAEHAPPATPVYIWVIIGIGAALVIAVIILIVTTRRAA